jgi:hypothetical protein
MITYGIFFVAKVYFLYWPFPNPALRMEKYEARVGAIYQDLKYKEGCVKRLVPLIFVLKRAAFAYNCWYWKVQLISQTTTLGLLNVCYLMHA